MIHTDKVWGSAIYFTQILYFRVFCLLDTPKMLFCALHTLLVEIVCRPPWVVNFVCCTLVLLNYSFAIWKVREDALKRLKCPWLSKRTFRLVEIVLPEALAPTTGSDTSQLLWFVADAARARHTLRLARSKTHGKETREHEAPFCSFAARTQRQRGSNQAGKWKLWQRKERQLQRG